MQLEIRSSLYTVAMGKFIGKKTKQNKNLKGTRQTQKIIWLAVINMDIKKSKDKLIKVSLRFSSDLIAVFEFKVNLAIGSNPWCLVLKVAFS